MCAKGTVFVDVDETLVKTKILSAPTDPVPDGFKVFTLEIKGRTVHAATKARPSARPFLESLACCYDVHVLTSGGSQFQEMVLNQAGLRGLVGTIYGGDYDDGIAASGSWVLVDDLKPWMSGIETKMERLGYESWSLKDQSGGGQKWQAVIDRHLVNCELFFGEEDKEPLITLLDEIASRMVLQQTPLNLDGVLALPVQEQA